MTTKPKYHKTQALYFTIPYEGTRLGTVVAIDSEVMPETHLYQLSTDSGCTNWASEDQCEPAYKAEAPIKN